MDWLHDRRFQSVRRTALDAMRQKEFYFRKIDKVLFLCGGRDSARRDDLAKYLRQHRTDVRTFYAEAAWNVIAAHSPTNNALKVEEELANLADVVVIVVESPGTFAELGAFASSAHLRKKLLPILDKRHRGADSFLATGPVRWVETDSAFGPPIWVALPRILEAVDEVEKRLDKIPRGGATRITDLSQSPKHLLFFICDLVAVFGPCPKLHIARAVEEILGPRTAGIDVTFYLGLGKALNLVQRFDYGGVDYFFRPLTDGKLPTFQHRRRNLNIPTLRAEILSAMLTIPAGVVVLRAMELHA